MNIKLLLISANACKNVYKKFTRIGLSTEYNVSTTIYEDEEIEVLAFTGTNSLIDWFWNFLLIWKDGVKFCSWLSAHRVNKVFKRDLTKKLMVTGHSKAGPTALYYKKKFGADWCVSICPAKGFRTNETIGNSILIIDPDDIVPKLGGIFVFKHPMCEILLLPNDVLGFSISDHFVDNIIEYLEFLDLKNLF